MMIRLVKLIVALLLCCICLASWGQLSEAYTPRNLQKDLPETGVKVHFIQITNGEASLIELEQKRYILVDTGNASSRLELAHYLKEHGIKELEYLFLSSLEEEYSGNVQWVLDNIGVKTLVFPYPDQAQINQLIRNYPNVELKGMLRGEEIRLDQDAMVKILHPSKQLSLSPQNNGLVFQLIHCENRFLFTGGITEEIELELIHEFDLHSQILKVSNFGSNQSSHADFLAEVDAHVAIIYHRPELNLHDDVLERLQESWAEVYDLKKHGHIIVISEKQDYKVYLTPNNFGE